MQHKTRGAAYIACYYLMIRPEVIDAYHLYHALDDVVPVPYGVDAYTVNGHVYARNVSTFKLAPRCFVNVSNYVINGETNDLINEMNVPTTSTSVNAAVYNQILLSSLISPYWTESMSTSAVNVSVRDDDDDVSLCRNSTWALWKGCLELCQVINRTF